MKWLLLFLLLLLLGGFILYRYRHGIIAAWQLWQAIKQIRQPIERARNKNPLKERGSTKTLVRCAKCGKWIPQDEALDFRNTMFFCSRDCVEKNVKAT